MEFVCTIKIYLQGSKALILHILEKTFIVKSQQDIAYTFLVWYTGPHIRVIMSLDIYYYVLKNDWSIYQIS